MSTLGWGGKGWLTIPSFGNVAEREKSDRRGACVIRAERIISGYQQREPTMTDLTYRTDGMFIRLYAETPAGEAAFNELPPGCESGVMLAQFLPQLKLALRKSGLTIRRIKKRRSTKVSPRDILKQLGV